MEIVRKQTIILEIAKLLFLQLSSNKLHKMPKKLRGINSPLTLLNEGLRRNSQIN